MEPIVEEDDNNNVQALSFQLDALKEGIYKRDIQIQELEGRFDHEAEKTEKLSELLKLEEQKNHDGKELIENLTKKLQESDELIRDMRERLGGSKNSSDAEESSNEDFNELKVRIEAGENLIKNVQSEMTLWKSRCEDLESTLANERNEIEKEKREHEQVKFKLSQSEKLLRNFRDANPLLQSGSDADSDDKYQNIITGLKASIDIQSERNIELHQQLQHLKKDSNDAEKLVKSLQEEMEKDKKLIEELNSQNSREYQRNEKLRMDIQRLKRDIDSWRKIQTDMKSQYQELRLMYDGVCKHADDQKREMLEMKLVADRDKRTITRQKDEVDKLKIRSSSLKQTYDDLKEKHDENSKLLEDKKVENRILTSQFQNAKKATADLTSSNKDLKKRSEFNQKELIEKHKALLQTEEKLKDLESLLEEKDIAIVEAKATVKEANEKAEKRSQEAVNKERDLMDRVTLVQDLQNQIQSLDDDVKTKTENEGKMKQVIAEKEKEIEEKKKETKEKEAIVCELEQRIQEMEKSSKDLEGALEKVKTDLENKEFEGAEKEKSIEAYIQELANKEQDISDSNEKMKKMEEETKAIKNELNQKEDHLKEEKINLTKTLDEVTAERDTKDQRISQLLLDLEEEQKRVHLQNQLLRDVEEKFEIEDRSLIKYEEKFKRNEQEINELKQALDEKDRVMEELKRELEESEIIQVYLNEIDELNKVISDERERNEQLHQKLENHGSEEASRIEEEKKEVMIQMTKELKREKQAKHTIIEDLKEDVRVLERNVENEKERTRMLSKEVEQKEQKMQNERESFLEHIEELQDLYSKEKQERLETQDRVKELESLLIESERQHYNKIQEFKKSRSKVHFEPKSNLILDRQEKIEELKQEIKTKNDQLQEAEQRLRESNKFRESEKLEFQILCTEKHELISSLRTENCELKKGWKKEQEWMEENVIEECAHSYQKAQQKDTSEVDGFGLLASQNKAIQAIKQQIKADFNLDQILPLADQSDEKRLDLLYEKSLKTHSQVSKKEAIKTIIQKFTIVLLLSPLAYFLSCEMSLSLAAVLLPLAFIIYHKPWKNGFDQEKILNDAVNGLSVRLAAECADNNNLRNTIEDLKKKDYDYQIGVYSKRGGGRLHEQFAHERKLLIEELEKQAKEEHEKQKEELSKIKQKQEGDRRRLQRQQALIDKLEIILQEKEIKSKLGQFWGYEELKMAINRLKHEREIEKNRRENSDEDIIKKKVAGAIEKAVTKENSRKLEAFVAVIILSGVLMLSFSANLSPSLTVAGIVVIASCSLVYGLNSWRKIEYFKNQLHLEQSNVEAQKAEIDELSLLMDREHDVVTKQKQAIEALEQRLNDEYKKNKDHQLTIAKLTWVFQESEEMRSISQSFDEFSIGKDFELQKLAEDHARDKYSIFRSMQKQLKEHTSHTEEQRKTIGDLKNATNVIVEAAEKQIMRIKSQKESRLENSKTSLLRKIPKLEMLLFALASSTTAVLTEKALAVGISLSLAVVVGVFQLLRRTRRHRGTSSAFIDRKMTEKVKKPSLELSFSIVKQCGLDAIFIAGLITLFYNVGSFSYATAVYFGVFVLLRLIMYVLNKRSASSEMTSWNDVVEDLWSQIHERSELIDVQTQEIQTLKKLLEVERSYSRHAERLLKEVKGASDEGFEELAESERLKKRASVLETEEERLANYELDEMKIFLEEEQRANVQLRKTLAEVEEAKRKLTNELTNSKRKLEMEQVRRKEINVAKEEEAFLRDRIEELMEDLEAEQGTKQDLNAQLIEERSSRELKEIELQDLKEKFRDEKHTNQTLREQLSRNQDNPDGLRRQLSASNHDLEEERLATQRNNIIIIEALHKLREQNMVLRRQIEDARTTDSDCMAQLRQQSEEQQDEIERIQTILDDIASTKKALKYQDLMEELQVLRQRIAISDIKPESLLENLELEREKNKILEEAVEELQRQQMDQKKMFEEERRRSIELARQLSGEDIPMMVEEDAKEELEDKRGVLYWLGTNGGLTDWKNPGESGLILISRSSYGHGRATDVANRRPSWCSTSNKPNQWWKIDFGEKRLVVPNAYSLRHGWSGNAGALRNWVMEGSLDGRKWILLRQHANDETINTAYGFGYWKINNEDEKSFRFIRVRQTGLNSNGRHALRLCGIEVYGRLVID